MKKRLEKKEILTLQQLVSLCSGTKDQMKLETRGNPVSAHVIPDLLCETFLWLIIDWSICLCKNAVPFLADVFAAFLVQGRPQSSDRF